MLAWATTVPSPPTYRNLHDNRTAECPVPVSCQEAQRQGRQRRRKPMWPRREGEGRCASWSTMYECKSNACGRYASGQDGRGFIASHGHCIHSSCNRVPRDVSSSPVRLHLRTQAYLLCYAGTSRGRPWRSRSTCSLCAFFFLVAVNLTCLGTPVRLRIAKRHWKCSAPQSRFVSSTLTSLIGCRFEILSDVDLIRQEKAGLTRHHRRLQGPNTSGCEFSVALVDGLAS